MVVRFIVEKDGSLSHIEVVRDDSGEGCGEAVVKALEQMPRWHPGKQKGREVRVRLRLPIPFELDS